MAQRRSGRLTVEGHISMSDRQQTKFKKNSAYELKSHRSKLEDNEQDVVKRSLKDQLTSMPSMPIIPSHSIDMLRDSMLQVPDSFIIGSANIANLTSDQEYAIQNIISK